MLAKEVMKRDYIKVDIKTPVSKLLGKLKEKKAKSALLFDNKTYKGIFSRHRLITSKLNPVKLRVKKMLKYIPSLTGEEDLRETARLMFTANCPILPIVEKGRVLGVVNAVDIVNNLDKKEKKRKIKDIATTKLIICHENDRTGKAIELMHEFAVSRLPIVDDKGELLSIVCLTDLMENYFLLMQDKTEARGRAGITQTGPRTIRAFRKRIDLHELPIKNFASHVIITASEDETVDNILRDMKKFSIGSIIIVRHKKPVGIVTIRDLLKLFLSGMLTF